MDRQKLTKEYLAKFPFSLQEALTNEKHKKRFLRNTSDDYVDTTVYRGLHRADEINTDDFLNNVDEAELYNRKHPMENIENYAISVNEDPLSLIKSLSIPNIKRPMLGIAKGIMKKECGPADFRDGKPHHNWFIFQSEIETVKNNFIVQSLESYKKEEEK